MSQEKQGQGPSTEDKFLFWACFIALIATAFGFVIRTMVIGQWATEFDLSPTQRGEIFGVGSDGENDFWVEIEVVGDETPTPEE